MKKNTIKTVSEIIKEIIEDNGEKLTLELTKETQLRDLGLTSFDLATLTVRIEDEFDVDIFEEGLVSSLGEIIEILESNT